MNREVIIIIIIIIILLFYCICQRNLIEGVGSVEKAIRRQSDTDNIKMKSSNEITSKRDSGILKETVLLDEVGDVKKAAASAADLAWFGPRFQEEVEKRGRIPNQTSKEQTKTETLSGIGDRKVRVADLITAATTTASETRTATAAAETSALLRLNQAVATETNRSTAAIAEAASAAATAATAAETSAQQRLNQAIAEAATAAATAATAAETSAQQRLNQAVAAETNRSTAATAEATTAAATAATAAAATAAATAATAAETSALQRLTQAVSAETSAGAQRLATFRETCVVGGKPSNYTPPNSCNSNYLCRPPSWRASAPARRKVYRCSYKYVRYVAYYRYIRKRVWARGWHKKRYYRWRRWRWRRYYGWGWKNVLRRSPIYRRRRRRVCGWMWVNR